MAVPLMDAFTGPLAKISAFIAFTSFLYEPYSETVAFGNVDIYLYK